ncbi:hypothetical protein NC652_020785 [Populus alba x Populus x berolinensis]|nr:hypothetical protein NC652_020785 [Populus alba x Populus x berolinensis]
MALLWEFSPHLWFSKPQEDKTQNEQINSVARASIEAEHDPTY